jgi:uncharacterized protein (TIGR02284 family)
MLLFQNLEFEQRARGAQLGGQAKTNGHSTRYLKPRLTEKTSMDNQNVISTLNDLIETCKDGQEGFRTCAENVQNSELKTLFMEASQRCAEGAKELQGEVLRLGGDPDTGGSISGAVHRGWLNIKSAITGKDEVAVLNECERGEDVAVKSYRDALDQDLPAEVRNLVERQYQGVLANHDRVRNLRDHYRAAT